MNTAGREIPEHESRIMNGAGLTAACTTTADTMQHDTHAKHRPAKTRLATTVTGFTQTCRPTIFPLLGILWRIVIATAVSLADGLPKVLRRFTETY
jgi:hypothetical protein